MIINNATARGARVAASVYMFYVIIYIYYNYNITLTSILFTIVMLK